jgi:hypothetical protein
MKTLVHARKQSRGQAMVELALTVGLFMLVVGGLFQFAMILWSQNTINQVARDTARWAVTQSTSPCDSAATRAAVASTASDLAQRWALIGQPSWGSASKVPDVGPSGVGVDWDYVDPPDDISQIFPSDCPPSDNRVAWIVAVRINHTVPLFMPGLQFIAPDCGAPGFCISSTAELRMEPKRP